MEKCQIDTYSFFYYKGKVCGVLGGYLFTPFIEWMPEWHPEQHQLQTQSLSMEAILATPPETHPDSH